MYIQTDLGRMSVALVDGLGVPGLDIIERIESVVSGLKVFSNPPLESRLVTKSRKNLILTLPSLTRRRPTLPKSS